MEQSEDIKQAPPETTAAASHQRSVSRALAMRQRNVVSPESMQSTYLEFWADLYQIPSLSHATYSGMGFLTEDKAWWALESLLSLESSLCVGASLESPERGCFGNNHFAKATFPPSLTQSCLVCPGMR